MLSIIEPYITPILNACLFFPFVAALFTLPYLIVQYRRFGGVAAMRTIVVYSFILYSMCAFFLTVLPLPTRAAVAAMPAHGIQWMPFYDPYLALKHAGFVLSQPATWISLSNWKTLLTSRDLFQILANIVMQIPLGFYLRYYFRRTWKQTMLIGLGVSLFYEITQLTGLYFIYPKAYRLCEMDDLINNTLGAMIGFWVAPLLAKVLPSRDELDRISYEKGRRVTTIRRLVAASIDWVAYMIVWSLLALIPAEQNGFWNLLLYTLFGYVGWVVIYFVAVQRLWKGRTIGKALLRVRVVSVRDDGGTAKFWQLLVRYATIYYLTLPALVFGLFVLLVLGATTVTATPTLRIWLIFIMVAGVGLVLFFLLRFYRKWNTLPHGKWSRTEIRQEARPPHPAFQRVIRSLKRRYE